MGRPKLENPLMNAERKKQWREKNKENKDETEKAKDRQRKAEKRSKPTNKEKKDQRERNKEYKRKSRANRSYQKVLGTRLKDRNHKQRDKDTPKRRWKTSNSCKEHSTPRVQQYRETKKSQNSPFQVNLSFKFPLRNLFRKITDNINLLKSPSKKEVAIRTGVNFQSPSSARAMQDAVMNSQSDEIPKLILSSLKNKRDKTSNATRCKVASSIAKSSTPLTTERIRNLQTSPSLLKAVSEQSIEDILFHAKIKQRSNNIDPILTAKVISFYNNNKISRVVPHKNLTVLVKNSDGTKECVCVRILEKTIEGTYHSFCNENPECSIN